MIRHLKLSEYEKSNRATSVALKKDAKRIKLQNEAKKKIITMIKEVRKNQIVSNKEFTLDCPFYGA